MTTVWLQRIGADTRQNNLVEACNSKEEMEWVGTSHQQREAVPGGWPDSAASSATQWSFHKFV